MVLETLIPPLKAERHPAFIFAIGLLYATVALWLAKWVFSDNAGIVMVFLATMLGLPLFYHTMLHEEARLCHRTALVFFLAFFFGLVLGFVIWYVVLPPALTAKIFEIQAKTIAQLSEQLTGSLLGPDLLFKIFLNNFRVLIFALLFSFIFGCGALFILSWNASVLATAIGSAMRTQLVVFGTGIGGHVTAGAVAFARYALHGIPEIAAYFLGGLAGGILSALIIRKDWERTDQVTTSAALLLLAAILLLILAAFLEVYVTPVLF